LPLFPDGVEHITSELAFEKRDSQVTYFNGNMPIWDGSRVCDYFERYLWGR
jgi:hypothetical protein